MFAFHRVLDGTAWNPSWRWHERRAPLLRLVAEDGTAGLGEAWSDQAEIGGFFTHARQVADWLLHRRCDDIAAIHAALSAGLAQPAWVVPAMASAVDMALWDMRARRAGLPLYRLLGGQDGTVPVYASGGLYGDGKDAAALAAEMRGYTALGFTAVKMKIGALPMAADLPRVAAVRRSLGPDVAIMVDAVGQLTPDTAPAWADALAGLGVHAIQAPLPATALDGMAALQARGPLAVVAQEREHDPAAFRALVARRAVGMLQFCPGLAGGITGGLALVDMAAAAAMPVTLQCYSTAVMQAACFHLGAARSGVQSVEYHRFHDNLYEALPPAMTMVRQGCLQLDDRPGLGLDPGLLDRPLSGPGSVRRMFSLPH